MSSPEVGSSYLLVWLTIPSTYGSPTPLMVHLSPGARDIHQLICLHDAAIYVCEPLQSGQNCICILQHNLLQDPLNSLPSKFPRHNCGLVSQSSSWRQPFHRLSTGLDNEIFAAYGLYTPTITHTVPPPLFLLLMTNDCLF